jgi:PAS domain S-box-containing protein
VQRRARPCGHGVAEFEVVRTAVTARHLVIGPYQVSIVTGRQILAVILPVHDAAGQIQLLAGAAIDLERLNRAIVERFPPERGLVTLLDRHGAVLARNLDPEQWVGTSPPLPGRVDESPVGTPATIRAPGIDGVERLLAVLAVERSPDARVVAVTGVPTAVAFDRSDRQLRLLVGGLLASLVLAGASAWWWSTRAILRPLAAVIETARRIAAGDLAARTDIPHDSSETGSLARTVDTLARSLSEEQAKYLTLAENLPEMIARLDREHRVIYANPAILAALELPAGRVLDHRLEELALPEELRGQALVAFRRAFDEGERSEFEVTFTSPRGPIWLECQLIPERNPKGEVVSALATAWDVSRRKAAEELIRRQGFILEQRVQERTRQLEAVNRELEAFSYSVSHDLRAPLRAIDGFARILAEDYGPRLDAEAQRLLGVIRRNADSMSTLIDDLLALSRAGRAELRAVSCDLGALAREVGSQLVLAERHRQVDLEVADLPRAECDPGLIRQVFTNLIGNALKFSRDQSAVRIEIGGGISEDDFHCYVKDDGPGFKLADPAVLFDPFRRQADGSRFEGSGIGLSIVQRIVTRHGGRVWAEGAPGQGATFHFTLPAAGTRAD